MNSLRFIISFSFLAALGACAPQNSSDNNSDSVDLWPHMVMIDVLVDYYEYTEDERIIPFLQRFFEYCQTIPEENFIPRMPSSKWHNWRKNQFGDGKIGVQNKRAGSMLPHLHWLYNRTRDPELLELATRFYKSILPPINEFLDGHVVNFAHRFAYPGIYSAQSGSNWHYQQSEYWYGQQYSAWGVSPVASSAPMNIRNRARPIRARALNPVHWWSFPTIFTCWAGLMVIPYMLNEPKR